MTWQLDLAADRTAETVKLVTSGKSVESQNFADSVVVLWVVMTEELAQGAVLNRKTAKVDETRFVAVREKPELEQIANVDIVEAVAAEDGVGPYNAAPTQSLRLGDCHHPSRQRP